jgi:CRP-like cAMP-binding protein
MVGIAASEVLFKRDDVIRYVHFPTAGFISLAAAAADTSALEVSLVGPEGMVGMPLAMDTGPSPFTARVLCAGSALRLDAESFHRELSSCPSLRETLGRYFHVRMAQLAHGVACHRFHVVEARLARWLLAAQDRARTDLLHVTHDTLAPLLGVRRVGITRAATSLQKRGLISYHRGHVLIADRTGLEDASCECYTADREIYRRILG